MADPERPQLGRERVALGSGGSLERPAEPSVARIHAKRPAGLGIDERELAHVDQPVLSRIDDLDRHERVAVRDLGQRTSRVTLPSITLPTEIGDEDDEARASRDTRHEPESGSHRRGARAFLGHVPTEMCGEAPQRVRARTRHEYGTRARAERDDPQPSAATSREMAEDAGHALLHVGLPAVRRAEMHRRRTIDEQPRRHIPLGNVLANVGLARPRADVPVDRPDVIAGQIRADAVEL